MSSKEIRQKFIDFFVKRGHKHLPSSSLIPTEDPSLLLTNAGMVQFKSYFMGQKDPLGDFETKRTITVQKCVRTPDIELVGTTPRHLTFFEMLGNFSFGDYFKEEAIRWALELLINDFGIDKEKLWVAVFKGEKGIPKDQDSLKIWLKNKIPQERIREFGMDDNFWGPTGDEGPCGPNTEIHYDKGIKFRKKACTIKNCGPNCECGRFVEIWNLVFMEYFKDKRGKFSLLPTKNVDTGAGLERILMVLNNRKSIFTTELFTPIIQEMEKISGIKYGENENKDKSMRIIADHLKAATFLLSDDITPSNLGRGYVLRRLIRRAIRYGKLIGIEQSFSSKIAKIIIEQYQEFYPELKKKKEKIFEELDKEEERFSKTLKAGLKKFNQITEKERKLSGQEVFDLFATYGFPPDLTKELAEEQGIKIDEKGFREEFKKHQRISKAGLEKKFKAGLVEETEETIKLHTATHLLQAALLKVLGNHVRQAGSNITPERLRFDFNHHEKMTPEEIKRVENLVNQKIKEGLEVKSEGMSYEEAIREGALSVYSKEAYPEKVKVYSIGDFSKEICGGPHVKNTSTLGKFKIIKEEASSAGIRRIKAILE